MKKTNRVLFFALAVLTLLMITSTVFAEEEGAFCSIHEKPHKSVMKEICLYNVHWKVCNWCGGTGDKVYVKDCPNLGGPPNNCKLI